MDLELSAAANAYTPTRFRTATTRTVTTRTATTRTPHSRLRTGARDRRGPGGAQLGRPAGLASSLLGPGRAQLGRPAGRTPGRGPRRAVATDLATRAVVTTGLATAGLMTRSRVIKLHVLRHPLADPATRGLYGAVSAESASSAVPLTMATLAVAQVAGAGAAPLLIAAGGGGFAVGAALVRLLAARVPSAVLCRWAGVAGIVLRVALFAAVVAGLPLPALLAGVFAFELAKSATWTLTGGVVASRRPDAEATAWHGVAITAGIGVGSLAAGFLLALPVGWTAAACAVALAGSAWPLLRASLAPPPLSCAGPGVDAPAAAGKGPVGGLLAVGAVSIAAGFGPLSLLGFTISANYGAKWAGVALLLMNLAALGAPVVAARLARLRSPFTGGAAALPLFGLVVWVGWVLIPVGLHVMLAAVVVAGMASHAFGATQSAILLQRVGPARIAATGGTRAMVNTAANIGGATAVSAVGAAAPFVFVPVLVACTVVVGVRRTRLRATELRPA